MAISEASAPPTGTPSWRRSLGMAVRVVQVRLRFPLVLLFAFLVIGKWDALRGYWDKLALHEKKPSAAVSLDTEYWCPMCPGVLSEWPIKCPVCNMTLVRRKKGEMTPLPSGVVARMQLSPYRIQLAGVKTAPIEYRPLTREVGALGRIERPPTTTRVAITLEVFPKDLPFLVEGAAVEVLLDGVLGRAPLRGQLRLSDLQWPAGSGPVSVVATVDDPQRVLQAGSTVQARILSPAAQWQPFRESGQEEWCLRTALEAVLQASCGPRADAGLDPLMRATRQLLLQRAGHVPAIPETAIVDTGASKVVYVETAPGTFDAVEVVVGPRCGGAYPLLRGPEVGQRVATMGAFLLDAETRLNPSLAASYFGAKRSPDADAGRRETSAAVAVPNSEFDAELAKLSPADQTLARAQKLCPITSEPLGSMGVPARVEVQGRTVFLCCKGCEGELRAHPQKYLPKLPRSP